ncbi:MAG TPA: hypothetical protein VKV77_01205 [Methylovirgula sp.]|nr:hypothetical protein [Methylovirgula sp.]
MVQTFVHVVEVLVATSFLAILLILPGAAIGAFADWPFAKELGRFSAWGAALLFSLSVLPALLSVIGRLVSFDASVATEVALAVLGIAAVRKMGMPPPAAIVGLLGCSLAVAFEFVDFQVGDRLYQPTLALDLVKHVATVNSILSWGLPLADPFVSRAQPAGYYYFFYTLAAVPVRLTMGALDARATIGALAVFDAVALLTLAALLWRRIMAPAPRNVVIVLVVLLICGNLDIIPGMAIASLRHAWPVQLEWWNKQIAPWTLSLLWVPHHVLALIAGIFGLLLISERPRPACAIVGGLAFASCVGASIWVGLGIVLTASFWLISLIRRRSGTAMTLVFAGGLAGLLLIPQIFDLLHGRAGEGFPIAFTIREFSPVDDLTEPGALRKVLRLVFLPVNYLLEFGIFGIGAMIYWYHRRPEIKSEAGRILACAALAGLLLGTFTRSTLLQNDLSTRVMLLPQLAFLVWTAIVISDRNGDGSFRIRECLRWPAAMGALLVIGYAGTFYEFMSARLYPLLRPNAAAVPPVAFDPIVDEALATAYAWANLHIPRDAILQHNPVGHSRVVDFGLYGRNRVAVADREAMLYGAAPADVDLRLQVLAPIFKKQLPAAEVATRAAAYRVDALVVSSADPVWSNQSGWVWSTPVLYASPHVRLFATRSLAPER